MRDRVDRRLGGHSDRALFCTFHAFAVDILGQHGSHLGIRPDFRPLTQDEDRIAILEEVIRELPDGDAELPPDRTSLLRLIAPGPRHNLFVVADDDQIIYQWNGASPRRFDDLRRDYELETVQLPESYRCPPEIVDHANRLVGHNRRLVNSRKTVAVREAPGTYADIVRHVVVGRQVEEAECVGRDIRERGLAPADCVVLGRTNRLVQLAAEGLQRAGLEAFVPQRKIEFDSPVPSVLVEALRLANSRHDRAVLRRICRHCGLVPGGRLAVVG